MIEAVQWNGSTKAQEAIARLVGIKTDNFKGMLCFLDSVGNERQVNLYDWVAVPAGRDFEVMVFSGAAGRRFIKDTPKGDDWGDPKDKGRGYAPEDVIGHAHEGLVYYFDSENRLVDVATPTQDFVPREALHIFQQVADEEISFDYWTAKRDMNLAERESHEDNARRSSREAI